MRIRLTPNRSSPGVCTASEAQIPGRSRRVGTSAGSGRVARAGAGLVIVFMTLVSVLAPVASAQQAESPEPLTSDPAIDAWVRTTFRIGSSSVSESTG